MPVLPDARRPWSFNALPGVPPRAWQIVDNMRTYCDQSCGSAAQLICRRRGMQAIRSAQDSPGRIETMKAARKTAAAGANGRSAASASLDDQVYTRVYGAIAAQ